MKTTGLLQEGMMDKNEIKRYISIGEDPDYVEFNKELSKVYNEIDPKDLRDAARERFRENDKLFSLNKD
jgi:hypothetical protein